MRKRKVDRPKLESRTEIANLRKAYDKMLCAVLVWMFVLGPILYLALFIYPHKLQ